MGRSRRRSRSAGWIATFLVCLAAPAVRAQVADTTFDRGLFDVRVGSLLSTTLPALVNARGATLLPVERVLALTGLGQLPGSTDSTVRVPMLGSTVPAVLDATQRVVRLRDIVSPLMDDELTLSGGEWYLATERLAELIGGRVIVDFGSLQIVIARQPPFPAEQQRASRDPRATYGGGTRGPLLDEDVPLLRRSGGLAAGWTASALGSPSRGDASVHLQLGTAIAGGSLSASSMISRAGFDGAAVRSNWQYLWVVPGQDWIRSIRLGNGGSATTGRAVGGIAISNARPFRSGVFAEIGIVPDVPPGWSYEVYKDGQLLGFSEAANREPVRVPMNYGSTPVELRFLGPAGEEIRTTYIYQVPGQMLQPGRVEYAVGGGVCTAAPDCRAVYANVDVGARSWLTFSAGAEALDSLGTRVDALARALVVAPAGWTGHLDVTRLARVAGFSYTGSGRVNGGANVGLLTDGSTASYVAGRRAFIEPALAIPLMSRGGIARHTLRLTSRVERPESDTAQHRVHVATALDMPAGRVALQFDRDVAIERGQVTLNGFRTLSRALPGILSGSSVNGSFSIDGNGVNMVRLGTFLLPSPRHALNAQVSWTGGPRGGFGVVTTYSSYLGDLRQSLGMNAAPGGRPSATYVVSGLTTLDQRVGARTFGRAGTNMAGVTGRVFYDEDGDGVFGPGDRPAEHIPVRAEGFTRGTDGTGRYTIWGITPFEPVRIMVDTLAVPDDYTPLRGELVARLTPNVYTSFDVPLVRTREVQGAVIAEEGVMTAAGVTVALLDGSGAERYTATTFSDGTYYIGRVRPGTYTVSVVRTALDALRANVDGPPTLSVPAHGSETIEADPVRLTPNR